MAFNPYMPANYNPFPINGGYNTAGQYIPQYGTYGQQQRQDTQSTYYVHGIEGANAFQMPPGVNKVTLWDEDKDQFYVKGYDNNGIPRVLAWNDYQPHIAEPEPVQQTQQINLEAYATKEDLNNAFNKFLSELTIGANGRIVRQNEHDA